jgi:hypothetical protein
MRHEATDFGHRALDFRDVYKTRTKNKRHNISQHTTGYLLYSLSSDDVFHIAQKRPDTGLYYTNTNKTCLY